MDSYTLLLGEFEKTNMDLEKIGALVKKCLVLEEALKSHKVYQDILEMACFWAAHSRDGVSFERYFNQLSSVIYFAVGQHFKDITGNRKWTLIGLQLLNLLITGRVSDFYILVEHLPEDCLLVNPFIQFPLKLEQFLIEGTYHRILSARSDVPAPEYAWFIDGLSESIRNDILLCTEASMSSLSSQRLASLFLANGKTDLNAIINERGWSLAANDVVHFNKRNEKDVTFAPNVQVSRVLEYSRHIEQMI